MNGYILTLAVLAIPIALLGKELGKQRMRRRAKTALAKAYESLVMQGKLSVEHAEMFGKKIIAIDRLNKKLLMIDHEESPRLERCIPLAQISSCRTVELRDEEEGTVKKIFLEVRFKHTEKPVAFCFYDAEHHSFIEFKSLARKAMHWKHRLTVVSPLRGSGGRGVEYVL